MKEIFVMFYLCFYQSGGKCQGICKKWRVGLWGPGFPLQPPCPHLSYSLSQPHPQ